MKLDVIDKASDLRDRWTRQTKALEAFVGNDNVEITVWFGGEKFTLETIVSRGARQQAAIAVIQTAIAATEQEIHNIGFEL